jgi:hypothetical protein
VGSPAWAAFFSTPPPRSVRHGGQRDATPPFEISEPCASCLAVGQVGRVLCAASGRCESRGSQAVFRPPESGPTRSLSLADLGEAERAANGGLPAFFP